MPRTDKRDLVAAAVSDGAAVDWANAEGSGSDDDRAFVRCLRLVDRIAEVHCSEPRLDDQSAKGWVSGPLPAPPVFAAPEHWGSLEVRERIGGGCFGDVFKAWDSRLDRTVALKILRPRSTDAGDDRDSSFVHEGRLMARVRHPNVASVFGAERVGGLSGLWMEFVRGRDLAQQVESEGAMPAAELARIGADLCDALDAVHSAGLVHRDVKAQNVMMEEGGRVVLMDFGTGLELHDEPATGNLAGTPLYLAPEVLNGARHTPQSDLYSAGVLLYYLATGEFPAPGRTLREVRRAQGRGCRVRLAEARPSLPNALATVIDRALSSDPAARYQHAAAMADALRSARHRRRWWYRPAAASVLVAAAIGVVYSFWPPPAISVNPGRTTVLLGSFENETGDPLLDRTLESVLQQALAGAPSVSVVPAVRVADTLRLMNRSPNTKLDAEVASEVAIRDGGIDAIVLGVVSRSGERLLLKTWATDVDGAAMFAIDETASDSSNAPAAVRRISLILRERFGEHSRSIDDSRAALEKVTTPSLRAARLYSEAAGLVRLDGSGSNAAAAERLLEEAVRLDPDFASAHILLAYMVNERGGRLDQVVAHSNRAKATSARATETERLFIEGTHFKFTGLATQDPEEWHRLYTAAAASYEALLRIQPDHYWAQDRLALTYSNLGRPRDAARTSLMAARSRPHSGGWIAWAAEENLRAGELDEAQRLAITARTKVTPGELDLNPWLAGLPLMEARVAWVRGDAVAALSATDAVWARRESVPGLDYRTELGMQLVEMYLTLGRLRQAEDAARWMPAAHPSNLRFQALATVVSERGDRAAAQDFFARRREPELGRVPGLLIESGLLRQARQVIDKQPRRSLIVSGLLAAAEGRLDEAIASLEPGTARLRGGAVWAKNGLRASRWLSVVWERKGDVPRAIAVLERASQLPLGDVAAGWTSGREWLRVRARLASLYRQSGRQLEADQLDGEVRRWLVAADTDHPLRR